MTHEEQIIEKGNQVVTIALERWCWLLIRAMLPPPGLEKTSEPIRVAFTRLQAEMEKVEGLE